jgi:poly-gamma-glutamate capsule biosynthesis protein CapA/YwtB (metallophosphatase superfamily)
VHNRRATAAVIATAALALSACTTGSTPPHKTTSASRTTAKRTQTTSATKTSTPTKPAARTVTVLGSGDVLIHPPLWEQAHADAAGHHGYDFGPMYASVAPDTEAVDLAICEMETPLAPPKGPFSGWPDFSAPPQVLIALKHVGYDSCTTASNHSIDQGYDGVVRTLNELDEAGLKHTGSARNAKDADTPLIITAANGVKIAQIAYSFDFNGIAIPSGKPWIANLTNVPAILAAAHRAKQAGADIVVLSMHWGTEYDHLATPTQKEQANALLASPDIDVILGDHAHVVQPAQKLHGKWDFYCMGNQISRHADPIAESREGLMPRVTFTEIAPGQFKITKVEAIPTWMQDDPKLRLIDIPRALTDTATTAAERATYQHEYTQIRGYLNAYGAIDAGLVVVH